MSPSKLMLAVFAAAALISAAPARSTFAHPSHGFPGVTEFGPGFVVHADAHFDPLIQRLMAERSLKVLPLRDGQLFYVVPVNVDPRLEEMQIRYLEYLLDKAETEAGFEPSAGEP